MTQGEKTKVAIIKFGNEEIGTNQTHLINPAEQKDGLSDYDFEKIEQWNSLAKNVRKREDINWVGSWVITLQRYKRPQRLTNAEFFEVCHDFPGASVMALIISWGVRPHGPKQPHTCTQNHSSHLWRKKEKQIPSFCQGHVQSNGSKNPFWIYPWIRTVVRLHNGRVWKQAWRWALANKSIKELKAENKERWPRVKKSYVCWSWKAKNEN